MDLEDSIANQNDLLWRLATHVIATTAGKSSNLVYSPALLNVILSFIAAKSPGATADQILSLLEASSIDELNTVSSKIVTTVLADSTASGGPTIAVANGFWMDKSLPVKPSFKDLLENSYKATFNLVDFRTKADEVNEEVNSWVENQTNGLITNLLAPKSVTSLTDSIFANALFFNGRWDDEFDPSLTEDSNFYRLDGTKVRVPFMNGEDFAFLQRLKVYEGFKVLNLGYRLERDYMVDNRSFSMEFYLPDEKDGLSAMLERLASDENLDSHRAGVEELKIPRFKFGFNFEASDALKCLGLNLPLETIIHKSCIEVDEMGSKAAAAAALIGIGACGPPKEKYDFVADHPFLFCVTENRSGLVLYLGQVIDPSMH